MCPTLEEDFKRKKPRKVKKKKKEVEPFEKELKRLYGI
jgi:hypothetical protein